MLMLEVAKPDHLQKLSWRGLKAMLDAQGPGEGRARLAPVQDCAGLQARARTLASQSSLSGWTSTSSKGF